MSRLPIPGSDKNIWGQLLNDFLLRDHNADGTHPTVTTAQPGMMSASDKTKLDTIETGATSDMTPGEILAAVNSVDGAGSGLDADRVDGIEGGDLLQSNAQNLTVSATAPTSPAIGDLWIDTSGS